MRALSDRKHIWFDGPAESGKTSLIVSALQSNRTKTLGAVRFFKNPKLKKSVVKEEGNEETSRYTAAGAQGVALIQYAEKQASSLGEFFWSTDLGGTALDALYCEGPAPADLFEFPVDFVVYVMRPLSDPTSLFERHELQLTSQNVRAALMEQMAPIAADSDKVSNWLAEAMNIFMEREEQKLQKLPPVVCHKLLPEYAGLAPATSIVVSINGEHERSSAVALLEFISAVSSREAGINHGLSYQWKEKKSTFIVNFNEPTDPELKKAVNMLKRRG